MNPLIDPSQSLSQVGLSPSLEEILRVGIVFLDGMRIGGDDPRLLGNLETLAEELRRTIGGRRPSELEPVIRTRRLYKSLGMDPTKERPSSERLLRLALRGRPFTPVNDLVDALSLVSLRLQFPLGAYDWDRVAPPVLIRVGQPEEGYRGIADEDVRLQGKIALVDGEGPFGSPSRDSCRTPVTRRTVRALVVAWAPAGTPRASLEEVLREIRSAAEESCGARTSAWGVLPH